MFLEEERIKAVIFLLYPTCSVCFQNKLGLRFFFNPHVQINSQIGFKVFIEVLLDKYKPTEMCLDVPKRK